MDLDAAVREYRRAAARVDAAKQAAERKIADARARAETARAALAAAMIEAANDGIRPVEIQRRTGYTKERVRQILRAGGVEPD